MKKPTKTYCTFLDKAIWFLIISIACFVGFAPFSYLLYIRVEIFYFNCYWLIISFMWFVMEKQLVFSKMYRREEQITLPKFLKASFMICIPFFIVMPFVFFRSLLYNLADKFTAMQHLEWFMGYLDSLFVMGTLYMGVYLFAIALYFMPFDFEEEKST